MEVQMRLYFILLFITLWTTSVLTIHGPASDCCTILSKKNIPIAKIKSYAIQSVGACSFKAVMFRTERDKTICADPNDRWTRRAMRKVDRQVAKSAKLPRRTSS
ncbi:eotaxin-like [Stigmatopora argus]